MSISENSVENTALQKLLGFDELNNGKSKSENRLDAFKWIEDLRRSASEAEYNIVCKKLDGQNDQSIEQEKLAILYEIGWFYNGNFYKKNKNVSSKIGYPNLAFNISVRKIDKNNDYYTYGNNKNIYMYMASYGIVDGSKDTSGGSYSLFLTLDDCISFILNELEYSHKDILYLKEMKRLFKESDNSQKLSLRSSRDKSKEEQKKEKIAALEEFSRNPKVQQKVQKSVENLTTNANVEKELYHLRRSSDTSTLLDFIDGFLIKLARKNYYDAVKHEEESSKANKLVSNFGSSDSNTQSATQRSNPPVRQRPQAPRPIVNTNRAIPQEAPSTQAPIADSNSVSRRSTDTHRNTNIQESREFDFTNNANNEVNTSIDFVDESVNAKPVSETTVNNEFDFTGEKPVAKTDVNNEFNFTGDNPTPKTAVNNEIDFTGGKPTSETSINNEFNFVGDNPTSETAVNNEFDFTGEKPVAKTDVNNEFNFTGDKPTPETAVENDAEYTFDTEPERSTLSENSFGDVNIDFTHDEENIFNDDDVISRIKDIMPGLFADEDQEEYDEEETIDDIIDKF